MLQNNTKYSLLKQIILTSLFSSFSIVLKLFVNKFFASFFFFLFLRKIFLLDFISFLPLVIIPLYVEKKYISFFGVFFSEAISFFLRQSKFFYNPFLSFLYAICWGFLPSLFLQKKNYSFLKTYFIFYFLFVFYFFTYFLLSLIWIDFSFFNKKNGILFFCQFSSERIKFFIYIKFLSIFFISFLFTYLFLKIKKKLINLY
ncbi:hypothetical protein FEF22_001575 [Texas Phoenix palm phytoplasma]|uniref:Uncharacterized protein n=1 Tax=Texas Phoenix palm phytoplasma TaxID=176709 RepID=A0ABS5BIR1_9MOLU|nr:hypothetical protein [Texas Phoenix palm phytoplasma]MBP3059467.1 hypothetical protein [Texas Phoenix palm phytoplasma]